MKNYKNEKLHQLTKSQVCSQSFWKVFKTLPETLSSETPPPVTEADWLKHFETLHSPQQKQNTNQKIALSELENLQHLKSTANSLDYPLSDNETIHASKKQKTKKATCSDLIKSETIKTSCVHLLPSLWCEGIITPIFKTGDKTDPGNYRGVCVSSCMGKFFSSIINERLLNFVESRNILHPSQIGFLKENRTSDHIFTLRTYSH